MKIWSRIIICISNYKYVSILADIYEDPEPNYYFVNNNYFIILARLCWAAASPRLLPTTATRCGFIKISQIFCLLLRLGNIFVSGT